MQSTRLSAGAAVQSRTLLDAVPSGPVLRDGTPAPATLSASHYGVAISQFEDVASFFHFLLTLQQPRVSHVRLLPSHRFPFGRNDITGNMCKRHSPRKNVVLHVMDMT